MLPPALRTGAVLAAAASMPLVAWRLSGAPLLPLLAVGAAVGVVALLLPRGRARPAQPKRPEAGRDPEEQLSLLIDASANLTGTLELPAVLAAILDLSRRLIAADAYAIWRLNPDTGHWGIALASGLSEAYQRATVSVLEKNPQQPDEPMVAEDVEELSLLAGRKAAYRAEGIRSLLVMPLRVRGEPGGTLVFYYRSPHEFPATEIRLATALANLAGAAVGTAEAYAAQSRLRAAAEDADRHKDQFLAMLSHELRNPLAAVRNGIQVFRLLAPDDANLVWARDVIDRQVQHLSRLVDDLLDVSRVARGKVQLQTAPLELTTIVARAVETSRPLIEARRLHLAVELPDEPVRLEGDLTRLAQVLANLLNNAAKYTDEGGRIGLSAERAGGTVVLRVQDSGIGIPAEALPHVFDLFAQADRSLARSEGGLGVGLTLVKQLVELHGGTVEAHSAGPGKGSEFVVRLPVLRGRPAEGPPAARPPAEAPRRRVLLVDDNADASASLALVLRLRGHEVATAADGPEALQLAHSFRPEVVLLDLGLPGMDGCEVARRLRGTAETAGVHLVALTGHGQEEDRRRAREAGCAAHLVKPTDLDEIERVLADSGPAKNLSPI
jgi:signal transduction histidine kinase/ActR/RegA family two-component response regulator